MLPWRRRGQDRADDCFRSVLLGKLQLGVVGTMFALGLAGPVLLGLPGPAFLRSAAVFSCCAFRLSLKDLQTIFQLAYSKIVENLGLAAVGTWCSTIYCCATLAAWPWSFRGALLTIYSVVSSASVPWPNAGNQLVGLYRSGDDQVVSWCGALCATWSTSPSVSSTARC